MFRVRTLIPYLEYGILRKEKVLPKQALFTKVAKGGKFSTIAGKMGYSEFGLFMEIIIQEAMICSQEPLLELFENCREQVPDKVQKYYKPKDFVEVGKLVREHFGDTIPTFEPEWASEIDGIVGHPDIVTDDCVYDIKTTGRFNAMRTETIFQILSYYCLARIRGLNVTHVGLVLPSQHKIFKVNIETWDWKEFWGRLKNCIEIKNSRKNLYILPPLEYALFTSCFERVGGHVEKKNLEKMLLKNLPLQFFVGGRVSTRITTLTRTLTKKLKNRLSPPVFIHAPYNINLSKPRGTRINKEDDKLDIPWTCYQMRSVLRTGEEAGINGVVVHCGKRGGISEEEAVKGMYESLCIIAPYIEEETVCPLLLETSSGQCGETLCDPHDFANFYLSLPEDVRKKIKICVDSCHVFAAGWDPMDFVRVLEAKNIPIALIHYNDSKVPKGAKKDRHACIGTGHIGARPLFDLLMWADSKNIPCVQE